MAAARTAAAMVAVAGLVFGAAVRPARAQDPAEFYNQVAALKKKAVDYLYSKQRDGVRLIRIENQNSVVDVAAGNTFTAAGNAVTVGTRRYNNVFAALPPGWFDPDPVGDIDWANAGGSTALAVLALLSAGEQPAKSPRLAKAIACLEGMYACEMGGNVVKNVAGKALKPGPQGTYAVCIWICILEHLIDIEKNGTKRAAYMKAIKAASARVATGYRADGGYDYLLSGSDRWDMSNTQYAMLALWAADNVTGEVPLKTLQHLNKFYLEHQNADGGFPYTPRSASSANMTAGAVASLMILLDVLHTRGKDRPEPEPYKPETLPGQTVSAAGRGLEWFGSNFKPVSDGYLMYSTERIGMAAGAKRFGFRDWYREGAAVLARTQNADGSWTPPQASGYATDVLLNTAFCLLFISHGAPPVVVNKLRYGPAEDFGWNHYPRDAAGLARWFSRSYEQPASWQVVSTDMTDDWDDAPVLLITGAKAPDLDGRVAEEIRAYIDRGGTVLCAACGNGKAFVDGLRDAVGRLYPPADHPEMKLRPVPADHPIYTMTTGAPPQLARTKLLHLHDGARSVLFVIPEDVPHAWNGGRAKTKEHVFTLFRNVVMYATDRRIALPPKLRPLPPRVDDPDALPVVHVAAIKYASTGELTLTDEAGKSEKVKTVSDWECAAWGWRSLNPWFMAKAGIRIDERRGMTLADPNLRAFPLVHLAGRHAMKLEDAEKTGIRQLVEHGGFLLLEDCGTNPAKRAFLDSAVAQVAALFPKAERKRLPVDHPIFTGQVAKGFGAVGKEAGYTRAVRLAEKMLVEPDLSALWIDGRPAVILSRFDVSNGVAGASYYDRFGFTPETSRTIAGNLIAWIASQRKPAAPVGAPAAGN